MRAESQNDIMTPRPQNGMAKKPILQQPKVFVRGCSFILSSCWAFMTFWLLEITLGLIITQKNPAHIFWAQSLTHGVRLSVKLYSEICPVYFRLFQT